MHSFLHFSRAKDVINQCSNTKKISYVSPRIWMSNFTKLHLTHEINFQNFTYVITILVKFDIDFLRRPWEILFGVTTHDLLHLQPLKNVEMNAILFAVFWYKVFVHWKVKLLHSLMDSVLKLHGHTVVIFFL